LLVFFAFKISHDVQISFRYKVHFLEFKETKLEYFVFFKRDQMYSNSFAGCCTHYI